MLKINDRGSETMGKYQGLAEKIVSSVGGKKNIQHVTHCMTRLRFTLKDEQIVEENVLKNMEGIITVIKSGGQFQVVIGNHVSHVFEEITPIIGESNGDKQAATSNGNVFNRLIDILSGCFQPFLGVLGAAGMILGLNALLAFFGTQVETFHYGESSGTYVMLYAIGNAIFFFMPIIVGYTSAIKFNLNPMVGIVIGAVLCYPECTSRFVTRSFWGGIILDFWYRSLYYIYGDSMGRRKLYKFSSTCHFYCSICRTDSKICETPHTRNCSNILSAIRCFITIVTNWFFGYRPDYQFID
jgi:glucose-like phosphotransferase system IIB component